MRVSQGFMQAKKLTCCENNNCCCFISFLFFDTWWCPYHCIRHRPCSSSPVDTGFVCWQASHHSQCQLLLSPLTTAPHPTFSTLIHAFLSSRVNYCGSLLIDAPKKTTDKLQRILSVAARTVSNTRQYCRTLIQFCRYELHWLDVNDRVWLRVCFQCTSAHATWHRDSCRHSANSCPAFLVTVTYARTGLPPHQSGYVRRTGVRLC